MKNEVNRALVAKKTKIFKSMNLIRRGSGASLNLFRYTAMVAMLLTLGIENAWAGHDKHTATLNVAKGTGSGTVYASTSGSATSGSASASFNCGSSSDGQHTGTLYAYATPASGYTFLGWTNSASSSADADNSNPKGVAFDVTDGSSTQTLYAHFVEKAKVNITFEAPSHGTYTIAVNGGSAETVSSADVVKNNVEGVVLTATPASGYVFAGWYKLNSAGEFVEDLSIESPYDASFTTSETIKMGARFVPTTLGKFILKGSSTQYYGLKMATVAAGGSGTIVPVADETLVDGSDLMPFDNGTYSIKAGATLLVPYSSDNKMQLEPDVVTTAEILSAYRTLVLKDGVNIVCNGNICVGGKIMAAGGGSKSAYVTGPCGVINMANGGHIELNSGAKLYCWGFIKGQDMDQGNNTVGVGTITANSGSVIWENFEVGDWRGGTATSAINDKKSSWKLFPFQSYSIQNIEVPTTYKFGSKLSNFVSINSSFGTEEASFDIIGSSGTLFLLKDAQSLVRKWYDPTTDLTCYELSGTAQLDALNITVYVSVSSSDFYLPISNSMHIILKNCNMTLSKPITMQAGSVIEIKEDATANLEARMHVFDKDDWGLFIHNYYFRSFNNLTSHKNRGAENSNEGLEDAKIIVDGTLNLVSGKGYLYSTNGGANIMGNGGGKVVFGGALPSGGEVLHHVTVSSNKSDSYIYDAPVSINTANLCNEDGSYTKSIASTTFHNVNGRWFAASAKDEKANHTYDFTYISSGAVSGTDGTTSTVDALYAPDKTGLTAGMKWCNVEQDGTCSNIFNATQALNETPASDIRYTYPTDSWLQLLRTETEGVYGGSDNSLYAVDGCAVNSLGSVDENCLYTINDVKKALVDGHFVALEKNTEDEAWHDVANPTNYYISFAGCTWHPATKEIEEKAYTVEGGIYIWYGGDWKLVEREAPYFFDYNDQNVKRYYEYEDGAWVLASPRVRVVDALEIRDFYKLPEAITVASGKKNATITILKDISGINTRMTYTAKNTTCTLDLNGHTVSGAAPFGDDNNRGLLIINASGTTFTITDNSANKEGRLENICNQNKVTYTVHLMAGTLNVEHGTIHAENPAQYASKAATVDNVAVTALTACGSRAVQVNAAQKLNISGGRLEAYATRNAYGIVASGNAANTTQVTITDGEIYAEAPCGAYGISCSGKLNISGGLVEAKLNDHLVDASYAATNASNNLNKHAECYAIHMSASANKTASNCYYGTLTVTGGTIKASSDLVRSYTSNVTGIRMYYSVAGMGNRNFASTSGTNAQQACAIGSVKNAEIIVQNNANYGYGIMVYGHYNSYNKTNSVFKVENTTIDVKAYNYAYGVYALGGIDGTTGECFTGDVELTNCTIAAEATNATTTASYAYGAWVYAGATTIFQDKQANYYGEYATAAKMTINGGSITAKTKTHYAYTAGTNTRARSTYGPQTSVYASRTRGGNAEAYPTLIINGGTYRAISGQQHARGISSGGNTTVKDAIFHVTAGTYNTYGLYAISGKLTATNVIVNDTAKSHSSNNANVYGVLVDCSIPSGNTAQTGFAYAGEVELNNCTITAVSPSYSNARALYVNATNKVHNWTQFLADSTSYTSTWAANKSNYAALYRRVFPCTIEGRDSVSVAIAAKATVNGGTFTAKAGKASAYGAVSTQTSVPANKEVTASPVMNLYDATFTATTGTSTTAYGVQSGGPTLIEGCTIEATAGNATTYQSTASGVRALDKTTTIKNSTITATATDKAYGLEGYVEINGTHGYCWHGEFNLSEAGNTEVTAEAKTKAKTSYAIYLNATKKAIASGNFAGDYATAANATINGGTYVAKFNTSGTAYVISLGAKQTQGSVVAQPEVEVLDGFFNGATAEVGTAGVVGHMQLKGGYFVHQTNLATYAVAPKSVWTLPNTHEQYNPYKYKVTEHYTITFKNGTTQLQQNDLETGTIPSYSGTPTKDGNAQYTYTFDGWSTTDGGDKLAALPAVAGEATYYAHFAQTENKYSVSVEASANGSVSPASVSEIGCETASGDITATPDAGYSFNGWTLPEGVTAADGYTVTSNPIRIHAIAADKTITANFVARTDINYTVKHWQQNIENDEYTEVTADQETKQGTTATATVATAKSYTGFTAQPITQETIAGNGSTIVNIYYNRNTFTITWLDGNGNAVETDENVKYGATPEYNGETPTKAATAQYSYTFNNTWSPALASVTGDATYTAQFTSTPRTYTITLNTNGGTINASDVTDYTYGTGATLPTDVTREGYTFGGWFDNSGLAGDAITSISNATTGDKTYWAKWALKKCTITWLNWDASPLKEPTITSTINYGSAPGYSLVGNPAPTRDASDGKTYEWDGWTTEVYGAGSFYSIDNLPVATGDATYYAHFRITAIDVASTSDISINEDAEVTTTTVRVEGKLNVPENRTLTTDNLILEGTPSSSGEIIGEGTVTATRALFDFSQPGGFKARTWYAVAVPWQVAVPAYEKTNNGVYTKKGSGEFVQQELGRSFDLIYYDGARRATGANKAWNYVEDDEKTQHIMYPGRAYMIYLTADADIIRFERKEGADLHTSQVETKKYPAQGVSDGYADWNGIANPATYHAYLNVGATENRGQIYNADTKQYELFNMSENKLVVGQPIFVQPAEETTIVANAESNAYNPSLAPRRAKAQDAPMTRYELMFAPNEGDVTDRIIVRLDEEKEENTYVVGQDLVKMGVSDMVPQMWVDRYDSKMCINTVAPINNRADYPLGISVQQSGAYDLFIDDQPDDETMLYLTYDGEAIWNLSYGGYVVNLEKGTNSHYGLRIVRSPKVTTDIEEATILNGDAVRKVIVEDKVFIIRNGEIYSIDGQLVK